jgi:hypothetical protein
MRNKTFKKARKAKGKWSLPFIKKKEETALVVYKEPSKPSTRVLKRKPKSSKAIEVRPPDRFQYTIFSSSGSPSPEYKTSVTTNEKEKRKKTPSDIAFQKYLKKDREEKIKERKRLAELEKLRKRTEVIAARRDLLRTSKQMRKERILASRYHPATYVTGKVVGKTVSGIMNKLTETPKKPKKRKVTTWW